MPAGERMPEIRRFGNFTLLMFFQDENPPHVQHQRRADFAAKFRIANGDLLAGKAPRKVLRQARRWVEENRAELSAIWDEFQR
jgi:hypothetical protein